MVCQRILACLQSFFEQLFSRKPYYLIETEVHINNPLRRFVTPVQMMALGVGGIIGK
jgi:hypothetical protein